MSTANFSKKKAKTPQEKALEEVDEFNKSFLSYIEENSKMVKDDGQLLAYHTMIELLIRSNKTMPIKMFAKFVLPYYDQIKKKDERFFLQDLKYDKMVTEEKSANTMTKILQFKEKWKKLTAEQKEYNFKMMNYLCYYAELYEKEFKKIIG